jgi:hypothetical protein
MTIPQPVSPFTRRRILQGAAALAASRLLAACGSSASSVTQQPTTTNPQPVPTGPLTSATITVSSTTAGAIGSAFAGLSYEKVSLTEPLFTASNANLIGLFKRLGPSVLRVGGNSVDQTVWTPNGPGRTAGQIAPSDIAALAAFVKAAGWQCLYGVNLEGSSPASPYTTTPALAAAEVASAYQAFGSSLLGIEIGNECDVYADGANYYAGTGWNLTTFETLWSQYRAAILATTPTVPITGPASGGHESTWTVPFGQSVTKSEITLLTQHYYRADGSLPTSTGAFLITPDPNLISDLQVLQAGAASVGVPFRMSECNSFYNGGAPGISDSYASALWVLDYLFNCAQNGASGVNFHGGGSGTGYTPIANSSTTGDVIEARPEFYGMLLFTLAGAGSLLSTQISAGSLNATAYTVKSATGALNLIILNKDSTQNLQASIALPRSTTSATLLEMTQLTAGATAPNLSATEGVTIQSATVNPDGTFSPSAAYILNPTNNQLSCYVPALSAVLLQIS